MTAEGKFFSCQGKHCRDCNVRAALEAWNKLPEVERKPAAQIGELGKVDPKIPTPPPGGLILQVYESRLQGDIKGEVRRRDKAETFGWGRYEPGRDYVWLTEADWKSLVPTDRKKGDRFSLPAGVAGRMMARLTDWSEANGASWHPEHVRSQDLTLVVEDIS